MALLIATFGLRACEMSFSELKDLISELPSERPDKKSLLLIQAARFHLVKLTDSDFADVGVYW